MDFGTETFDIAFFQAPVAIPKTMKDKSIFGLCRCLLIIEYAKSPRFMRPYLH